MNAGFTTTAASLLWIAALLVPMLWIWWIGATKAAHPIGRALPWICGTLILADIAGAWAMAKQRIDPVGIVVMSVFIQAGCFVNEIGQRNALRSRAEFEKRRDSRMRAQDMKQETWNVPVVGWRAWQIWDFAHNGEYELVSTAMAYGWPRRTPAVGTIREFRPNVNYGFGDNGIFLCNNEADAAARANNTTSAGDVWGEAALAGTIIEHEDGYRGEYAYPLSLKIPKTLVGAAGDYQRRIITDEDDLKRVAASLANAYGIDVEIVESTEIGRGRSDEGVKQA